MGRTPARTDRPKAELLLRDVCQLFGESEAACSPGCCRSENSWGRGEYGLTGSGPSPSEALRSQSPVTEQARGAPGAENTVADEPKASQILFVRAWGKSVPEPCRADGPHYNEQNHH